MSASDMAASGFSSRAILPQTLLQNGLFSFIEKGDTQQRDGIVWQTGKEGEEDNTSTNGEKTFELCRSLSVSFHSLGHVPRRPHNEEPLPARHSRNTSHVKSMESLSSVQNS